MSDTQESSSTGAETIVAEGTFSTEAGTPTENTAVETKSEAQETVKPEANKEDVDFSTKFAALSRREKILRQKEAKMKADYEAKIQELEKKYDPYKKYEGFEDRLKTTPLEVLKEYGLSYEELTKIALNEGNPTPEMLVKSLESKLDNKYKTEIENLKKQLEEKEINEAKKNEELAKRNFMNELESFVSSNEKYELIKQEEAIDLVYDVIEAHYQETGRILSNEEAADHVETYLEAELDKRLQYNKVKKKLGASQAPAKPVDKKGEPSITLSNTVSQQVPNKGDRKLTDEQSLMEAAKLIKWQE